MLYNIFANQQVLSLFAILFTVVISITLHECAHGLVALWNGDYTAKAAGRLTLNPVRHFDLLGFIMLMAVGFGFAKPVPVNPNNFRNRKRGIFTVAIAGVTVNILLAFIFAFFNALTEKLMLGGADNFFNGPLLLFLYMFTYYMVLINISLALFNLLPFYPLDGFRVIESFTRYINPVTSFLRVYGRYILIGLIGAGLIIDYFNLKSVSPVFEYLDIIGFYIEKVGGFIREAFLSLWSLVLGV